MTKGVLGLWESIGKVLDLLGDKWWIQYFHTPLWIPWRRMHELGSLWISSSWNKFGSFNSLYFLWWIIRPTLDIPMADLDASYMARCMIVLSSWKRHPLDHSCPCQLFTLGQVIHLSLPSCPLGLVILITQLNEYVLRELVTNLGIKDNN